MSKSQPGREPEGRPDTPGSNRQEDVEDRDNVGTVKPEDYPPARRAPPINR